jgi:glycosidase
MPWHPGPGGGFTGPGVPTWLPMRDPTLINVSDERKDPGSVLNFMRDLIALRRTTPDLQLGDSVQLPAPDGCWAWRRGQSVTVVLNMSDTEAMVGGAGDAVNGTVAACTDRSREAEAVAGSLTLAPWTGAVVVA